MKVRYRQTILGVLWVVLQPLLAAMVLAFVFGRVAGVSTNGVPMFAVAFCGVLAWSSFATTLSRSAPTLLQNATLVSRVYFPRALLPLAAACAVLVDTLVGLALVLCVSLSASSFGPRLLAAPVFLLAAALLGVGVGLAAAGLMVSFRDVQHVLPLIVQLTLFLSPVAYCASAVPERYRPLYLLNPLVGLVEGFRWAMLGMEPASWASVAYGAAAAAGIFVVGVLTFRALERYFADVI